MNKSATKAKVQPPPQKEKEHTHQKADPVGRRQPATRRSSTKCADRAGGYCHAWFLPDLLLSIHKNERKVWGSTTPECYFPHPINSSCHDITEAKSLPYTARKVLGLGGKFIATPPYTTARRFILDKLEHLSRDGPLKVHFSGEEGLELGG